MSFKLGEHLPAAQYKTLTTLTWGATPNSCTITNPQITTNSRVDVWVTGSSAQAAGNWSFTPTQGQLVITSSNAESSTLPLAYIIL